jgi:hypothetical protein
MEAKVENLGDNANCFMRTILISIFFLLIGHFYFGKNRTFLNWLDNAYYILDIRWGTSYTPTTRDWVIPVAGWAYAVEIV